MPRSIDASTDQHVRAFFAKHPISVERWPLGPALDALPDLSILQIGPGPRLNRWTYVTIGAWAANAANPFEYLVIGDDKRPEYLELLTMAAFYGIEHTFGVGHIIPIGRPLVPASACEHVYFSLPYTFGPALEVVNLDGIQHRILWLFPITEPERQLLRADGIDALESRFEAAQVQYWSPLRASVI